MNVVDGILLTPLDSFPTPKGDVFHAMKKHDLGFVGFGEAYFTSILPGMIKGWHKHLRMTINFIVPVGKTKFVVFDDRKHSKTRGQFYCVELSVENYQRLTIPPNLWVAFKGEGSGISLILDIADIEYDATEIIKIDLKEISYNW